jgi:hypothetical protein
LYFEHRDAETQLGILRLLGRLKTVEQVNELRQIISNYYAQKATEEMGGMIVMRHVK